MPGPGQYSPKNVARPATPSAIPKAARFPSHEASPGWLPTSDTPGPGAYSPVFNNVVLPNKR